MIRGRVGVWDPSKLDDVIYEQPLMHNNVVLLCAVQVDLQWNFLGNYYRFISTNGSLGGMDNRQISIYKAACQLVSLWEYKECFYTPYL